MLEKIELNVFYKHNYRTVHSLYVANFTNIDRGIWTIISL